MKRYFLKLSYKGTNYSGFQGQLNANTVQAEVEKAFNTLQKVSVEMVSSSRTDTGVHALENYFHFDTAIELHPQFVYKMNAILPADIVIHSVKEVSLDAHSRFDAIAREYRYYIYGKKNPFLQDRAYYFPYKLDIDIMKRAAKELMAYDDFTSFSKRNTQVKTFICKLEESNWEREGECLVYHVKGNRFLRGMVRGLTGTMLKLGRGRITLEEFHEIIRAKDCTRANFSVPGKGLFLVKVSF
jgi:tRNA pseudouridine38-40 synthase